jgi:hypothetical protein
MAAQFKSNVRLREEKGFGSISMKRLIFSGVGAVFIFMGSRMTPLAAFALPILVISFGVLLMLSGSRGGIPLWQRLLLGWRARLLLAAQDDLDGLAAQLVVALNLHPSDTRFNARNLYSKQRSLVAPKSSEWAIFNEVSEAQNGDARFLFVDAIALDASADDDIAKEAAHV